MKPNGVGVKVTKTGDIGFSVRTPTKVEDAVWEAVQMAIDAGWSPQQFKNEIADAWRERLNDEAKDAVEILSR